MRPVVAGRWRSGIPVQFAGAGILDVMPPSPEDLPPRSTDETDIGWGDRPERDDDSRLLEDRPPHWDDV